MLRFELTNKMESNCRFLPMLWFIVAQRLFYAMLKERDSRLATILLSDRLILVRAEPNLKIKSNFLAEFTASRSAFLVFLSSRRHSTFIFEGVNIP